jgi:hypothetical protein
VRDGSSRDAASTTRGLTHRSEVTTEGLRFLRSFTALHEGLVLVNVPRSLQGSHRPNIKASTPDKHPLIKASERAPDVLVVCCRNRRAKGSRSSTSRRSPRSVFRPAVNPTSRRMDYGNSYARLVASAHVAHHRGRRRRGLAKVRPIAQPTASVIRSFGVDFSTGDFHAGSVNRSRSVGHAARPRG